MSSTGQQRCSELAGGSCVEAAISLQRLGIALPPVPLRPEGQTYWQKRSLKVATGKEPSSAILRAVHRSARTRDLLAASEEQIRSWYALDPRAGLGAFIPPHLIVLDLEAPPDALGLVLPVTPSVLTSRGAHAWFANPNRRRPGQLYLAGEKVAELRTSSASTQRQQVVVPPTSVNGRERSWLLAPEGLGIEPSAGFFDFRDFDLQGLTFEKQPSLRRPRRSGEQTLQGSSRLVTHDLELRPEPCAPLGPLPPFAEREAREAWFAYSQTQLCFVAAQARALGLDSSALEEDFLCVLHREATPSARLTRASGNGQVVYRDFDLQGTGQEYLTLPEVRAALAYGAVVELNRPEQLAWMLILLVEARLVEPAPVSLPALPGGAPAFVRQAYDRLLLYLGARWLNPADRGSWFPLSVRFRRALFALPYRKCKDAMAYFLEHGILDPQGRGAGPRGSNWYSIGPNGGPLPSEPLALDAEIGRALISDPHNDEEVDRHEPQRLRARDGDRHKRRGADCPHLQRPTRADHEAEEERGGAPDRRGPIRRLPVGALRTGEESPLLPNKAGTAGPQPRTARGASSPPPRHTTR
jgi:hypothetical protein